MRTRYNAEELSGFIFDALVGRPEADLPSTATELGAIVGAAIGDPDIATHQIRYALEWVRDNSVAIGWTIPNLRSGKAERAYRVIPVMAGTSVSDSEAEMVRIGWQSRVQYARTTAARAIEPLRFAAEHADDKATQMTLRTAVGFGEMLVKSLDLVTNTF